ncbi:MAG TPA: thiamine pyrophosphate-dependent dehydrogenase E1 component subunit alpha [Candidatus Saccharimonadales bacterium]|nr:thiamine pyrophosphate-dependent dehydrogenase E1 component subunit alpha [Candidatus Saccharimonadales bacterium]
MMDPAPPKDVIDIPDADYGDIPRATLLDLYHYVRLTREVELQLINLFKQSKVVGGLYPGYGHEATTVGTALALGPDDVLLPLHRDLGAHLARRQPAKFIFAQYMGKATSPTHGKDGNVHLANPELNIVGCISHIGAMLPVAVGISYAGRLLGKSVVTMSYVGDGGSSIGEVHEALNFAAVLNVPFVLVVENNRFAYSTPVDRQYKVRHISDRAAGYGMVGDRVDGNNVLAVYAAARRAVERGRRGEGPTMLECETVRMLGHSVHDAAKYVPPELIEAGRRRDPVARYESYLLRKGVLQPAEVEDWTRRLHREVAEAVEWAEQSPLPEPADAGRGVFAEPGEGACLH